MHRLGCVLAGFLLIPLLSCGDIHDAGRVEVKAEAATTSTTFNERAAVKLLAAQQLWDSTVFLNDAARYIDAAQQNAVAVNAQVRAAQGALVRPPATAPPLTINAGSVNGYPCGGDLPSCCTLRLESGGNPYAVEPGHRGAPYGDPGDPWHHASGLWQDMPDTWNHYRGYPYAAAAPADVQNEFNRGLWNGGAGWRNWKGDGCYPGG